MAHIYEIELIDQNSEPRAYRVKISGESKHDFFVGVDPSQNVRIDIPAKELIQWWCELNFKKLPKDGGTLRIDLDEVRKAPPQRM